MLKAPVFSLTNSSFARFWLKKCMFFACFFQKMRPLEEFSTLKYCVQSTVSPVHSSEHSIQFTPQSSVQIFIFNTDNLISVFRCWPWETPRARSTPGTLLCGLLNSPLPFSSLLSSYLLLSSIHHLLSSIHHLLSSIHHLLSSIHHLLTSRPGGK